MCNIYGMSERKLQNCLEGSAAREQMNRFDNMEEGASMGEAWSLLDWKIERSEIYINSM